ncbi:DUF2968 domain-containing protein [Alcaligenes ammonioxydans]|nr:DUF2968 domain-containing protein [Alcaligenes ammonioxydans]
MVNLSQKTAMLLSVGGLLLLSACSSVSLVQEPERPVVAQTQEQEVQEVAPVAAAEPASAPAAAPAYQNTTVAQLQQLIQARGVQELRTAYNGRFGASLLFSAETMTYYVALFQQREFWRVFKTTDESLAERMYTQYRQDTVDFAAADLERIKLQAEVANAEKKLNESADQLTVLQNDLALQRQQEALAIAQREESRREAQALAEQEREAREQLRELQRQIKELEQQRAGMLQRQKGR